MEDYKELYFILFLKISDIINELKEIQAEAEEHFISQAEKSASFDIQKQNVRGCLFLRKSTDDKTR
jgi:hypothetical protein